MTCQEIAGFLDAYLANELKVVERWIFEAHLRVCPDCRNYLDGYRKTIEASRAALQPDAPPPAGMPEALVSAILKARVRPHGD